MAKVRKLTTSSKGAMPKIRVASNLIINCAILCEADVSQQWVDEPGYLNVCQFPGVVGDNVIKLQVDDGSSFFHDVFKILLIIPVTQFVVATNHGFFRELVRVLGDDTERIEYGGRGPDRTMSIVRVKAGR